MLCRNNCSVSLFWCFLSISHVAVSAAAVQNFKDYPSCLCHFTYVGSILFKVMFVTFVAVGETEATEIVWSGAPWIWNCTECNLRSQGATRVCSVAEGGWACLDCKAGGGKGKTGLKTSSCLHSRYCSCWNLRSVLCLELGQEVVALHCGWLVDSPLEQEIPFIPEWYCTASRTIYPSHFSRGGGIGDVAKRKHFCHRLIPNARIASLGYEQLGISVVYTGSLLILRWK